jgi:hypothetical protein
MTVQQVAPARNRIWAWFSISLSIALLIGCISLIPAIQNKFAIHDDARIHVAWMLRYIDPQTFPHDYIADYFQNTEPIGYSFIYRFAALLGISSIKFNCYLPVLLTVIVACFAFLLSMQIVPSGAIATLSTILILEALWLKPDLASATPRAFVPALLLAFLYALSSNRQKLLVVMLILQALFYPPVLLICWCVWLIQIWNLRRTDPVAARASITAFLVASAVAAIAMIPGILSSRPYGPLVTLEQSHSMPWFSPEGKHEFFSTDPVEYYLKGANTGFVLWPIRPHSLWLALLLPIVWRWRSRSNVGQMITPQIKLLLYLIIASIFLFVAAHVLLFHLYVPSRYTRFSFQIAGGLAASIFLVLIFDFVWNQLSLIKIAGLRQILKPVLILFVIVLPIIPFEKDFPRSRYVIGKHEAAYKFLSGQSNILIASLSGEADNLPAFTGQSILSSRQYWLPWYPKYYWEVYHRFSDSIRAQYTDNYSDLAKFISAYHVDEILVDSGWRNPEYVQNTDWANEFHADVENVESSLRQGHVPALFRFQKTCTLFSDRSLSLIDAHCVEEKILKRMKK